MSSSMASTPMRTNGNVCLICTFCKQRPTLPIHTSIPYALQSSSRAVSSGNEPQSSRSPWTSKSVRPPDIRKFAAQRDHTANWPAERRLFEPQRHRGRPLPTNYKRGGGNEPEHVGTSSGPRFGPRYNNFDRPIPISKYQTFENNSHAKYGKPHQVPSYHRFGPPEVVEDGVKSSPHPQYRRSVQSSAPFPPHRTMRRTRIPIRCHKTSGPKVLERHPGKKLGMKWRKFRGSIAGNKVDAGGARRRRASTKKAKASVAPQIRLPEYITFANLATTLGVRFSEFSKKLKVLGFTDTSHDFLLNAETAALVASEYGLEAVVDKNVDDLFPSTWPEKTDELPARPPVVTIMGHVDHGKTTILDYLRKSSIAAEEEGGITQHIGAFSVSLSSGKQITFLDTPGHAAFLSMRQRGANVTDIVVLVVAADDGVMPQTVEAIKHANEARVPIIVAISKIDKGDADLKRVKDGLAREGVYVEDFGGETQVVGISGKTGQGMDKLEEAILTLSEVSDHRAPPDGPVEGWILEASTTKAGKVATMLIKRGTLKKGMVLVAGRSWARARILKNETGRVISEATPGTAVRVEGWTGLPEPGDITLQAPSPQKASSVVKTREENAEKVKLANDMETINKARRQHQNQRKAIQAEKEAMQNAGMKWTDGKALGAFQEVKAPVSDIKEVTFIIKADVIGSAEAVVNLISGLGNHHVQPRILRHGVGSVVEFDIEHAALANGHIIAFSTNVSPKMRSLAEKKGVTILEHRIIYHVAEAVNKELASRMPNRITTRVVGEAEVFQLFPIFIKRKEKIVAGCKVRNGVVSRNLRVKVFRRGEVVYNGSLFSLKHKKKDVDEMRKDSECGLLFDNWDDVMLGDKVQCFEEVSERVPF